MRDFDWKAELAEIFGAQVRQETLEAAAAEMAHLAAAYPDLEGRVLQTLDAGIRAAREGDVEVCWAIEQSGYYARSTSEGEALLSELRQLYQDRLSRN